MMYILRPDIDEERYAQEVDRCEELVRQEGGEVGEIEERGKRSLAYEIKHYDQGYYVLMNFTLEPDRLPRVDERFKLNEAVLRHQIVRLSGSRAERKERT
ncbi:MAG: 30S ribosomal protein S6 [Candidatus Bipolaricaulia bacterium]